MNNLSLRIADFADEPFLRDLCFDVRRDEFGLAGLPEAALNTLLTIQYAAQKQSYESNYPEAENSIIELEDEKVGRLLITRDEGKIHLVDIAILRGFRGRGIGSVVLGRLKSEAEMIGLSVFKTNFGAINLYQRHGFKVVRDNEAYFEMEWENA